MSDQYDDREMIDLENALSSLSPAPSGIDRDGLMFQAGQSSARRRGRIWPLGAAALAGAAIVLGAALVARPAPTVTERVVYVPIERPRTPPYVSAARGAGTGGPEQAPVMDYFALRAKVLAEGLDALPEPQTSRRPREPESLEDLAPGIRWPYRSSIFQRNRSTGQPGGTT